MNDDKPMTREKMEKSLLEHMKPLFPIDHEATRDALLSWVEKNRGCLPDVGIPVYEEGVLIGHAHYAGVEVVDQTPEDVAKGRISFSYEYRIEPVQP